MELRAVCVYCGSNTGRNPAFPAAATALGRALAERDIHLVYGGGRVGLMGVVADAVLAAGGGVSGIITEALVSREIGHHGLGDLTVVATMHDRKLAMADRADAFVMLPGGFGTLEEFFEAVTWLQLGIHRKPCGVLDVEGFFDPLLGQLGSMVDQGFVHADNLGAIVVEADPARLLDRLAEGRLPVVEKWLDSGER